MTHTLDATSDGLAASGWLQVVSFLQNDALHALGIQQEMRYSLRPAAESGLASSPSDAKVLPTAEHALATGRFDIPYLPPPPPLLPPRLSPTQTHYQPHTFIRTPSSHPRTLILANNPPLQASVIPHFTTAESHRCKHTSGPPRFSNGKAAIVST